MRLIGIHDAFETICFIGSLFLPILNQLPYHRWLEGGPNLTNFLGCLGVQNLSDDWRLQSLEHVGVKFDGGSIQGVGALLRDTGLDLSLIHI